MGMAEMVKSDWVLNIFWRWMLMDYMRVMRKRAQHNSTVKTSVCVPWALNFLG